jgi:hypothetical protein
MANPEVEVLLEEILEHIADGKIIIPVIGEDLIRVEHDKRQVPLYSLIAGKLAERLDVKDLPEEPTLSDVVYAPLNRARRRGEVHLGIQLILKGTKFRPLPRALLDLARIKPFNLFISLTFDPLLANAIDHVRFGGANRTEEIAYSTKRLVDLPCAPEELVDPVVYHLLGKFSAQPGEYVVTDEDMLEFLNHMQRVNPPPLLRNALGENHLLFIGCSHSDWLARFFIRIVRGRRLSQDHTAIEALVSDIEHHTNLIAFLTHFSPGTRIVSCPPSEFVTLLLSRYLPRADEIERRMSGRTRPLMTDVRAGVVFLSYAHEDYTAARRLHDFLVEQGIEVWFDEERLKPGDAWKYEIEQRLRDCSYFMPVISATSVQIQEGFFLREWALAKDRSLQVKEGRPFIIPVVIDDTSLAAEEVPEWLRNLDWIKLQGGEGNLAFSTRMRELVRNYHRRRRPR